MTNREAYFRKNVAKKVIAKDGDLYTAFLVNEVSYGIKSSTYRDFLYESDGINSTGYLNEFSELRKNAINKAIDFHEKLEKESFFDVVKNKNRIRGINKREYWKNKNFLEGNTDSDNVKYYGDDEELIPYDSEKDIELDVHHLKLMKDRVKEGMTLDELKEIIDPKYSVAMTPESHRYGKKIGHGGNSSNAPKTDDIYEEGVASMPNEYYAILKEKREELINYNLDTASLKLGLFSAALLSAAMYGSKKGVLQQLTNERIQQGIFRVSVASFAITSREISRDSLHESPLFQKLLFESRDSFIESKIINDSLANSIGDIDFLADAASFLPFYFVIQTGRFLNDVRNNGFDTEMVFKHGTQFAYKTAYFSGGKFILASFMDPTFASIILVGPYMGFMYFKVVQKKRNQLLISDNQARRTKYYIRQELSCLSTSNKKLNNGKLKSTKNVSIVKHGNKTFRVAQECSSCSNYEYSLTLTWDQSKEKIMFIGFQPNNLNNIFEDNYLVRCIKFAEDWGYGSIVLCNLFAYKTESFKSLKKIIDPVGPDNDEWLLKAAKNSDKVVAAWGNNGDYLKRSSVVKSKMNKLYFLELNKSGEPSLLTNLNSKLKPKLMN